jgi:hypothetical protein
MTSRMIGKNGRDKDKLLRIDDYLCVDKRVLGACDKHEAFYLCEVGKLGRV